jgi:hypothetical protein
MSWNFLDKTTGQVMSSKRIMDKVNSFITCQRALSDQDVYFVNKLYELIEYAYVNGTLGTVRLWLCMNSYSKSQTHCPALCFVVYHNHAGLTKYVLSQMNAEDITLPVFSLACEYDNIEIINAICEKDPIRFYTKNNKKGKITGYYRTKKEQNEYKQVLRLNAMYETLAVWKYGSHRGTDKYTPLSMVPKEVMREHILTFM